MDASRARETALASGTNEIRVILNESTRCRDCRIAFRCGAARLACDAFAIFLNGGSEKRWEQEPRVPSRARYEALLA
jgi:hypothetical protein